MLHIEVTDGAGVHGKEASLNTWRRSVEAEYVRDVNVHAPAVRPATAITVENFIFANCLVARARRGTGVLEKLVDC